jgi:ubiquitin-protein ligase
MLASVRFDMLLFIVNHVALILRYQHRYPISSACLKYLDFIWNPSYDSEKIHSELQRILGARQGFYDAMKKDFKVTHTPAVGSAA